MRKFRIKVTTNFKEYLELTKISLFVDLQRFFNFINGKYNPEGLYYNYVIWVSKLSPKLLFHEFVHHIIGHPSDVWYINLRLFGDILNCLWDITYFRLTRLKASKEQSQEAIRRLKESIKDWLDWVLCRDVI